jgi:hypothetical protein
MKRVKEFSQKLLSKILCFVRGGRGAEKLFYDDYLNGNVVLGMFHVKIT